jgi:hypothetical protein
MCVLALIFALRDFPMAVLRGTLVIVLRRTLVVVLRGILVTVAVAVRRRHRGDFGCAWVEVSIVVLCRCGNQGPGSGNFIVEICQAAAPFALGNSFT